MFMHVSTIWKRKQFRFAIYMPFERKVNRANRAALSKYKRDLSHMVWGPTFLFLNACPRGQVSESEAMLRLKATSRGAWSRYGALATSPEVPSLGSLVFFR